MPRGRRHPGPRSDGGRLYGLVGAGSRWWRDDGAELGIQCPGIPRAPRTSEPGPSASTSILTEGDSGRTVTVGRGGTVQLRLSGRWRWEAPSVDGDSIVLVRLDYESDPGFRAWEVRAVHPGDAVIQANGRPGPRSFRMAVHVVG